MASRYPDPWSFEAQVAAAESERARQQAQATCYVKRWSQREPVDQATYLQMLECLGLRPYTSAKQRKSKGSRTAPSSS